RCYEGEGAPAFWPWIQIIRSYISARQRKALMCEMGDGAADIAQLVPEVRHKVPELPTPPALEAEQARFRLFDSVARFITKAAQRHPLVVVLDDLHWADKPSLLLLNFVARRMADARILIVGTYRDVELDGSHPLTAMLNDLGREHLFQRIMMHGLP